MIIEENLQGLTWLPKTINSDNDFITIDCPEHGLYHRTVSDIKRGDTACPRCQFLLASRMIDTLLAAQSKIDEGIDWLSFYIKNKDDQIYMDSRALFYRILVTHKETGLLFQKIGVIEEGEIPFDEYWSKYKWPDFIIEPIDKIECSLLEANTIEAIFQKDNSHLKVTVPNYLKFNTNKTYEPDFIWQARSKTIKAIRDMYALRQKQKCVICDRPLEKPTLDHVHTKKVKGTGLVRNTICNMCNTYIARVENNASRHALSNKDLPDILRNMANHLEQEKKIIHPTEQPKRKKVGKREWNRVRKHYFDVYPNRRTLPKQPTYVTDNWLEILNEVNKFTESKKK